MGNKKAKFKKMYKEIDKSGNGEVGFNELAAFIISNKVVKELKEFSNEDISAIEKEFNEMDEADADGKLTFEEFMEAMKKNKLSEENKGSEKTNDMLSSDLSEEPELLDDSDTLA